MTAERSARDSVDHLLLGVRDLDEGIAWLERKTSVKAVVGGVHPGRGTRNALASLGGRQYLEIIAPDPAQTVFTFQIDIRTLTEPRLVTWAASTADIDSVAASARAAGIGVLGPADGSRQRPDGSMLRWRSLAIDAKLPVDGVDAVPFFIQWDAGSRHPSGDSPSGLTLTSLELRHPGAAKLQTTLKALGIDAAVQKADAAELRATLATPRGPVILGR